MGKLTSAASSTSSLSYLGRPPQHGEPAFFHFETDEALSGAGIFSPPMTRAPSPSNERMGKSSALFMTPSSVAEGRTRGGLDALAKGRGKTEKSVSEAGGIDDDGNEADASLSPDVIRRRAGIPAAADVEN